MTPLQADSETPDGLDPIMMEKSLPTLDAASTTEMSAVVESEVTPGLKVKQLYEDLESSARSS